MEIRNDLMYTKSHEWIKEEGDLVVVGLTDYAQHELGDLVFVNLPEAGDDVTVEETFADVESVKAVSDVYSPVSGTVAEINEELLDAPQLINEAAYDAWFVKVENVSEKTELLTAEELSEETGIPVNNMRKLFNDKDLAVQTYTRPRKVTRYAWNEFIKERR